MSPDVRWMQRFTNFHKALELLREATLLKQATDLEKEGMIQRFEYTFELAWKTMKDFLEDKGFTDIVGPRDTIRLAFANSIVTDGEPWMEMIIDRNLTTHIYDQAKVNDIAARIAEVYYPCFVSLDAFLENNLS